MLARKQLEEQEPLVFHVTGATLPEILSLIPQLRRFTRVVLVRSTQEYQFGVGRILGGPEAEERLKEKLKNGGMHVARIISSERLETLVEEAPFANQIVIGVVNQDEEEHLGIRDAVGTRSTEQSAQHNEELRDSMAAHTPHIQPSHRALPKKIH